MSNGFCDAALLRGTYRITLKVAGFRKYLLDNPVIRTGEVPRIDVQLQVGTVTETVEFIRSDTLKAMEWYEAEVQELERATVSIKGNRPPVFYGSSSIRLWDTLAVDFDPAVLNLGFGGSTLEACDHFFERLVPPVRPRSLLLYAGDNDLGDGQAPEAVFRSFRSLARRVSASLDGVSFYFLSVKPSPSRYGIIDRIRRLNEMVRTEIATHPGFHYIDAFPAMLDSSGKPRPELFLDDGLHLSREGYRLWAQILKPYRNEILTAK